MEVEAKVKVDDLEKIKKRLIERGAKFYKKKMQVDYIFRRKGEELATQGPGGYILRVRESDKNALAVKVLTDRPGVWIEHETDIANPTETKAILLNCGFSQVLTMTKKRIPGRLGEFELCLDDIKELGKHLEVALDSADGKEAKRKIVQFFKNLGFEESQIIHKGYVAILFERMGVKYKGTG